MEFVGQGLSQSDANVLEITSVIGNQIGLFIERARVEEAKQESDARYRCLADTDSEVLVTIDEDLNIMFVNKGIRAGIWLHTDRAAGTKADPAYSGISRSEGCAGKRHKARSIETRRDVGST